MSDMKKAVVIGAGIAGLITARMLSDYYDKVCIIERDELPSEPANRQGVPQSFHPHRVLPGADSFWKITFPDTMTNWSRLVPFLRMKRSL